jgi:tetratricopeptide (TPR) repeat protein
MRKLLSCFVISSVVILVLVILDVNQRFTASANTIFNIIQNGTPLTLSQLEELINVPTPDHTVALIIQQRKIAFTPTEKILARLKNLGAGPETIKGLRKYLKLSPSAPRPSPRPSLLPPPKRASIPNTITILVAKFRGPDPEKYLVTDKIIQELVIATKPYPDISIQPLEETITEQTGDKGGSEYARDIGAKRNASIVLWGYYGATSERVDISVYFEVLRAPKRLLLSRNFETQNLPIGELDRFNIQTQLSKEMSYLVLLTVGLARLEALDYKGAIDRFTKALASYDAPKQMIHPYRIYVYRAYAYDLNKGVNRIDLAIADYNKAIQINPDVDEIYALRGILYFEKGQYDAAIADFDKAIKLCPDFVVYYIVRGLAYGKKGQSDSVIADFSKVIKLTPDDVRAYLTRADAYVEKAQYDRALDDYNTIIKLKPNYVDAYASRGTAYSKMGKYDLAIIDLNKAIKLKPDEAVAYLNRGIIYAKKIQYDLALADCNTAIKIDSHLINAYFVRAIVHRNKGEIDHAIDDLKSILQITDDQDIRKNAQNMLQDLGIK